MEENLNIRLIAADIDGTLLNSQGKLSELTIRTIQHVQQQGISFVLATGRGWEHFAEIRTLLDTESYPQNYYIVYNGAEIFDGRLSLLAKEKGISPLEAMPLLKFAKDHDIEALCYTSQGRWRFRNPGFEQRRLAYLAENHLPAEGNIERLIGGNIDISDPSSSLPSDCLKIAFLHSSKRLRELIPDLRSRFPQYEFMMVTSCWLEIVPQSINKGSALRKILEFSSIPPEDAAAFGDGENDIEMISSVKYGYAMSNAFPHVKSSASRIAPANDEDGVAKEIMQLFGYDLSFFSSSL